MAPSTGVDDRHHRKVSSSHPAKETDRDGRFNERKAPSTNSSGVDIHDSRNQLSTPRSHEQQSGTGHPEAYIEPIPRKALWELMKEGERKRRARQRIRTLTGEERLRAERREEERQAGRQAEMNARADREKRRLRALTDEERLEEERRITEKKARERDELIARRRADAHKTMADFDRELVDARDRYLPTLHAEIDEEERRAERKATRKARGSTHKTPDVKADQEASQKHRPQAPPADRGQRQVPTSRPSTDTRHSSLSTSHVNAGISGTQDIDETEGLDSTGSIKSSSTAELRTALESFSFSSSDSSESTPEASHVRTPSVSTAASAASTVKPKKMQAHSQFTDDGSLQDSSGCENRSHSRTVSTKTTERHRNISATNSDSASKLYERARYNFPGWRGESTDRESIAEDSSAVMESPSHTTNYRPPTVHSENSDPTIRYSPHHGGFGLDPSRIPIAYNPHQNRLEFRPYPNPPAPRTGLPIGTPVFISPVTSLGSPYASSLSQQYYMPPEYSPPYYYQQPSPSAGPQYYMPPEYQRYTSSSIPSQPSQSSRTPPSSRQSSSAHHSSSSSTDTARARDLRTRFEGPGPVRKKCETPPSLTSRVSLSTTSVGTTGPVSERYAGHSHSADPSVHSGHSRSTDRSVRHVSSRHSGQSGHSAHSGRSERLYPVPIRYVSSSSSASRSSSAASGVTVLSSSRGVRATVYEVDEEGEEIVDLDSEGGEGRRRRHRRRRRER